MAKRLLLKGTGASVGIVRGKVYIINKPTNLRKFQEGSVLVTHITDPTMVSAIAKASAIICDIGSIVSHPSIVARELGIPCVVGTKKATSVLKNGMEVTVNGKTGEVFSV